MIFEAFVTLEKDEFNIFHFKTVFERTLILLNFFYLMEATKTKKKTKH